jgi:hypothetical protein
MVVYGSFLNLISYRICPTNLHAPQWKSFFLLYFVSYKENDQKWQSLLQRDIGCDQNYQNPICENNRISCI